MLAALSKTTIYRALSVNEYALGNKCSSLECLFWNTILFFKHPVDPCFCPPCLFPHTHPPRVSCTDFVAPSLSGGGAFRALPEVVAEAERARPARGHPGDLASRRGAPAGSLAVASAFRAAGRGGGGLSNPTTAGSRPTCPTHRWRGAPSLPRLTTLRTRRPRLSPAGRGRLPLRRWATIRAGLPGRPAA